MTKKFSLILVTILTLVYASAGFGASTVSVTPAGNGVFVLQGTMENVSALDITISYDAAALSSPRVSWGPLTSGALTAENVNMPGRVALGAVRIAPMQGSGVIATLTFDRKGSSAGSVAVLSARLANVDGQPLSVSTGKAASDQQTQEEQRQGVESTTGAASQTTSPQWGIGLVAGQAGTAGGTPDMASPETQGQAEAQGPDAAVQEPAVTARKDDKEAASLSKTPARKIHTHKSVLDRFEEYKGERTAKVFISFFEQDSALGFRQEPAVVLADGKTAAKVAFISDPGNKSASDVALTGARLISIKKDPDYTNTWIVELVPERDTFNTSLAASLKDVTVVFPLAVAPKLDIDLDKSGKVTEADFALFMAKRGTPKAPQFDLNRDGKRDHLDDYFFTANYLAAQPKK
jgi:hypothetical protein